jgi:branched-chain amino acid transport system substrate-binding protein
MAMPRGTTGVSRDGAHVLCETRIARAQVDNQFVLLDSSEPSVPVCRG